MRRIAIVLCLPFAFSLGCSHPEGPEPLVLMERALAAVGGREVVSEVRRLGLVVEGRLHPPEGLGGETPLAGEMLLRIPDGLAVRMSIGGLLTRKSVTDEGGWLRQGAAVIDLPPDGAREERADRDDFLAPLVNPLLSSPFSLARAGTPDEPAVRVTRDGGDSFLLSFDPETGLPAKIRRAAGSVEGRTAELLRTFSDWQAHGALLYPSRIVTEIAGGSQRLTVRKLAVNPEETKASFRRPDDSGPGDRGEIRRETLPPTNVAAVSNEGALTQLASVDLFLLRSLEPAMAKRRGPLIRIFKRLPAPGKPPVVVTLTAVDFSRDSAARSLPSLVRVELLPETEALVMPYTGPYPTSSELYEPLLERAKELGLFPTGAPQHAILSDPDAGEPNELRQEIRLPVREKE